MDIGLAGISLAFQIFAACIQGFAIVAAACSMTKDARLMGCILGLEEQKLLAWARMSGLLDDKMDRRLNTDAILLALRELSLLLNDREKLRSYGLTVDPAGSADDVPASLLDANNPLSQEGVDDGRHKADRKAVLRKADKALVMGKRLRWALFDKTQMESYIQRVHSLVDNLQSLLDEIQKETLLDDLRMIKLQMIGLANTVDDMRLLEQAERATQSHDTQESMLARLRTFRIRQDQDHQGLGDQEQNGLQTTSFLFAPLPVSAISNVVGDPHMSRGTATFNGRRVLLEWKHYDHGDRRAPQIFDIEKRITDLFQLLNAPKPRDFYTPRCLAYYEDSSSDRFGFIFDEPVPGKEASLLSLLQTPLKPSLTVRLQLACALAKHVFQLLVIDWLHKGLRSENILFSIASPPDHAALWKPYIFGYEYSRPNSMLEVSERPPLPARHDVYRHPDVQSGSTIAYTWHHDVYSLGLILLEIAKWRPLKRIVRSVVDVEKSKTLSPTLARQIQLHILSRDTDLDHLGDVEFRCGTTVMEVIRSCLYDFGEMNQARTKAQLQRDFHNQIVAKLERCCI